jgi:hypothetical protein
MEKRPQAKLEPVFFQDFMIRDLAVLVDLIRQKCLCGVHVSPWNKGNDKFNIKAARTTIKKPASTTP